MSQIDDLRDALRHECAIAIHLHAKLPPGAADYRPTPKQRSTLELLRYLAGCGIGSARAMREGTWDGYKEAMERVADLAYEDFPEAMRRQERELGTFFDGLAEADLGQVESTLPWGEKVTLRRALLETTLKWMCAYRMQLFLYAKACGNETIGTPDNWAGVDAPA